MNKKKKNAESENKDDNWDKNGSSYFPKIGGNNTIEVI
jgi:hypothetical protein